MKLPMVLKLKPGLKWSGKLKVLSKEGDKYLVAFDALSSNPSAPYIYDRYLMPAEIIESWTGVLLGR